MMDTKKHSRWHWVVLSSTVLCWLLGMLLSVPLATGKGQPASSSPQSGLNVIRGVVRPFSEAVLSSQVEGRIRRIPYKDGQRFKKGSTLILLHCSKYRAELAAAKAEHETRKKILANQLGLLTLKAIGKLELEVSKAEVWKAKASLEIANVNARGCRIRAPFSGRVVKVLVHEHENILPNDELLSILDDRHLEIELVLPSKSLQWLKKGAKFGFAVDETSQQYSATVKEIGASVDPASQTIRVLGEFTTRPKGVLAGMSGTASLTQP